MARTRTRRELADDARALADQGVQGGGNQFVSDAQANAWINQELAALHSAIIAVDPFRFMAETTISTTPGVFLYTLPTNFHEILMVERQTGAATALTIDPFTLNAKNEYTSSLLNDLPNLGPTVRYLVRGQGLDGTGTRLWMYPDPGNHDYQVYYVTNPPELSITPAHDEQPLEGEAGWLDWVVYGVAIRMLEREQSDTTGLRADKREIQDRIELAASRRDGGRPVIPTDVRRASYDYPRAR